LLWGTPHLRESRPQRCDTQQNVAACCSSVGGLVLTGGDGLVPLGAWFSGLHTYKPFVAFQAMLLVGVPQIATGILSARMGRSLKIAATSESSSLFSFSAIFWTSLAGLRPKFSLCWGTTMGRLRLTWWHNRTRAPRKNPIAYDAELDKER